MDQKESLFSGINPFDDTTTATKFLKGGASLIQGWSLVSEIWKLPILVILVAMLSSVAKESVAFSCLLVLLASLVVTAVKYQAYRALRQLSPENTGSGLGNIIVTWRKYELLITIFNLPILGLFIFLILNLIKVSSSQVFDYNLGLIFSSVVGLIFIAQVIIRAISLHYYKKLSLEKLNKAQVLQSINIIDKKISLVLAPLLPIVATIFLIIVGQRYHEWFASNFQKNPIIWAIVILWALAGLFFILSLITVRRIASVDLSAHTDISPVSTAGHSESKIVDNQVELALYGVSNTRGYGFQWLGKGKMVHAENTLLVTKDKIAALVLPVLGAGVSVEGVTNQGITDDFLWNRAEVREKAEALLQQYSVDELVKNNPGSFILSFDQIGSVKLVTKGPINTPRLEIASNDGSTYKYIWLNKDYKAQISAQLPSVLGNKFSID